MKNAFKKLLLLSCLVASIAIPVYANAPPSAETEGMDYTFRGWLAFASMLAFPVLCGIVVTCFCEWVVSLAFQFDHRNDRLIVWTNVVSQILMWLVYILLGRYWELDNVWLITILEILIYTGEFLFYRRKMYEVSWQKCLIYTVAANTASLLLGLLIL